MIQQVFRLLFVDSQYGARADVGGPTTCTFFAKYCDNCAWSEKFANFSRYGRLLEKQPETAVAPGLVPDGARLFGLLHQRSVCRRGGV